VAPEVAARSGPFTTEQVLREEAAAIHGEKAKSVEGKSGRELYRELNRLDSAALCLSGGGIRSAAFALGVIQALAVHPRSFSKSGDEDDAAAPVDAPEKSLLAGFHYLSTVSGGGYIGSWLTAWRWRTDFPTVWNNLVGRPDGPDIEPPVIAWLRSYSNYLTPKTGMMSADSWTTGALYLGNLILNWLLILPYVCALVLTFKTVAWVLVSTGAFPPQWHQLSFEVIPILNVGVVIAWFVLALQFFAIAGRFTLISRPSLQDEPGDQVAIRQRGQGAFIWQHLLMSALSALALTQVFRSDYVWRLFVTDEGQGVWIPNQPGVFPDPGPIIFPELACAALGVVMFASAWVASGALFVSWRRQRLRDAAAWIVAGVVYGELIGIGFYGYLHLQIPLREMTMDWLVHSPIFYFIVGVPWILLSQLVAEMIFAGLISYDSHSDADREWLGRAGGWKLVTAIGYLFVAFLIFPNFKDAPLIDHIRSLILPIGAVSALVVTFLAWSGLSPAQGAGNNLVERAANAALMVAAPLFAGALIFLTAIALDLIQFGSPVYQVAGAVLSILVGVAASKIINVNQFSLHAIYRNRLVRAFLGASARQRRPNPFTGFDPHDTPRMHSLWPSRDTGWRPFHVINTTLNIVSSKRLAWQERKAASFTISPLHCGTGSKTGSRPDSSGAGRMLDMPVGAYRSSVEYGGQRGGSERRGITLGTAMAISGAAASPNMGYHSSPAITFLMTMFNVRLGWWLGNPGPEGEESYRHGGPKAAIAPLFKELFGLTTDDQEYVYLSDGGHFENLGLYEMVRRRCRFMVVVDAGCDPQFGFADLGNAVRKIEIDLGVPISFGKLEALRKRPRIDRGITGDYYAVGEAHYRAADGDRDGKRDPGLKNGVILYIKPGYHGSESAGIRSYAMANRDFPHQTTADQSFSESQFESYRALGFEIADGLFTKALQDKSRKGDANLASLLNVLKKMHDTAWRRPPAVPV
jgi:hypothetical protein